MSGFGGVVSFEIDGDRRKTSEFVDAVCLPYMGCAGRILRLLSTFRLPQNPCIVVARDGPFWDRAGQVSMTPS